MNNISKLMDKMKKRRNSLNLITLYQSSKKENIQLNPKKSNKIIK